MSLTVGFRAKAGRRAETVQRIHLFVRAGNGFMKRE